MFSIELFHLIVIRRFEVVVRAIGRSLFMVLTTYFDVCTHFMFEQREEVGRPAARACTSYIYMRNIVKEVYWLCDVVRGSAYIFDL